MFEMLKKGISKVVKSVAGLKREKIEKVREEIRERVEEKPKILERVVEKIVEKKLSERDVEPFLEQLTNDLIEADTALEVAEKIKMGLKQSLVGAEVRRLEEKKIIVQSIKKILEEILSVQKINIEEIVKMAKAKKGYATIIFFGINGVGKSLSLAKVGYFLKNKGYKVLLAAGDTFRSGSIEQLEKYGEMAGLEVIKQKYGADSCAVIFDARKAAEARRYDVVLADTSGRMHVKKGLMDELAKIVRVNNPDLKILVLDSLSGSDVLQQCEFFDKAVGIDGVIFSKVDVNEKGGNILSICHRFKKPILFLGTGQGLKDLEEYDSERFINQLTSF